MIIIRRDASARAAVASLERGIATDVTIFDYKMARLESVKLNGRTAMKTDKLLQSLQLAEEIAAKISDGTITAKQAIKVVNGEFSKHPHRPKDRAWANKWLPIFIEEIQAGNVSEDEAIFNIHRCIA
jgi:hypothetical protein